MQNGFFDDLLKQETKQEEVKKEEIKAEEKKPDVETFDFGSLANQQPTQQQQEVEMLRQLASQQEQQLQAINQRANQLTAQQSELAQGLIEQQQRGAITQQSEAPSIDQLVEALTGISSDISDISGDDAADKIKSWIEKS